MRRIEKPEARTVRVQPLEMIHRAHCDSLARTVPTKAAGVMASPVMANKATPTSVVEKYLVEMKYKAKDCSWEKIYIERLAFENADRETGRTTKPWQKHPTCVMIIARVRNTREPNCGCNAHWDS